MFCDTNLGDSGTCLFGHVRRLAYKQILHRVRVSLTPRVRGFPPLERPKDDPLRHRCCPLKQPPTDGNLALKQGWRYRCLKSSQHYSPYSRSPLARPSKVPDATFRQLARSSPTRRRRFSPACEASVSADARRDLANAQQQILMSAPTMARDVVESGRIPMHDIKHRCIDAVLHQLTLTGLGCQGGRAPDRFELIC